MKKVFFIVMVFISCDNLKKNDKLSISQNNFNNSKNEIVRKVAEKKVEIIKNQTLIYSNDSIKAVIYLNSLNLNSLKFEINFKNNNFKINEIANLILLEDEFGKIYVPEGSAILDEKNDEEYFCDSTYNYISSKDYKLSFSFEKKSKKRMSFIIYKSKVKDLKNGFFTLYKN